MKCHITFDGNPAAIFYSGSNVTGKVEVILDRKTSVRGIAIKFYGRARTSWNVGSGDDRRSYDGKSDYLSSVKYLIGSETGETLVIEPGIHTFNFSCSLPMQLPSSFEGTHGSIRYSVQLIFDRPIGKFNKTYTVGITILKLEDLNSNESPSIRMPSEFQSTETFWCGPCATNPLDMRFKVPQLGYVSGQSIIVFADIHNNTNINIDYLNLSLVKIIKYSDIGLRNHNMQSIVIVEKQTTAVNSKTSKVFQDSLKIPAIPPTCTTICNLIQIVYELRIKVKMHGFHISPVVKFPITIGNIPLSEVINQQPGSSISIISKSNNSSSLPVIDNIPVDSIATIAPDCHISPPTYEQAVYMKPVNLSKNQEHPICESPEYIPKYPVYNFSLIAPKADEIDALKNETNGIWI